MADVVVACAARPGPGVIGRSGWVRSRAWTWLFSSTHRTMARSGGVRYSPTTSRTFSTKYGSVESLNVSARCGFRPNARQIRPTADLRQAGGLGHAAGAPVGGVRRLGLQRPGDDPLDVGVGDRPRGAGPGLVGQPVEPALRRTAAATCRRWPVQTPRPGGDGLVVGRRRRPGRSGPGGPAAGCSWAGWPRS